MQILYCTVTALYTVWWKFGGCDGVSVTDLKKMGKKEGQSQKKKKILILAQSDNGLVAAQATVRDLLPNFRGRTERLT